MKEQDFKNLNFSVLGKHCELEGTFSFVGDTVINSRMKGIVTVKDQGRLTFERGSEFEGQVTAHDVEIFGVFKGSIKASGTLIVRSSGEVSGIVQAQKISVYPGATLNIEGHTPEPTVN